MSKAINLFVERHAAFGWEEVRKGVYKRTSRPKQHYGWSASKKGH